MIVLTEVALPFIDLCLAWYFEYVSVIFVSFYACSISIEWSDEMVKYSDHYMQMSIAVQGIQEACMFLRVKHACCNVIPTLVLFWTVCVVVYI